MKRNLILLVLILLLLELRIDSKAMMARAVSNHKETVANENTFAIIHGNLPDKYLEYLSANYDIVLAHPLEYELTNNQLNDIQAKYPQLTILRHRTATELYDISRDYVDLNNNGKFILSHQNSEEEWRDIWLNHKSWFLRNKKGEFIHRKEGISKLYNKDRVFVMDPANPGWQDWLAKKAVEYVKDGYDGIFLDLASASFWSGWDSQPINNKTGGIYTRAEWRQSIIELSNKVKKTLGSNTVFINGLGSGSEYYLNDKPNALDSASIDGFMIEGFMRWDTTNIDTFRTEQDWKKDVDLLEKVSRAGKIVIANTNLYIYPEPALDKYEKVLRYSLASYLLGKNGNRSFFKITNLQKKKIEPNIPSYWESNPNVYSVKIGDPLAPYYYKDNLYQRDFSNGKVIVNPTDTGKTFKANLGDYYLTLDGDLTNTVKLAPKTAIILLRGN
jgi:hypothetical protein